MNTSTPRAAGWRPPYDLTVYALNGGCWRPNARGVQVWVPDRRPTRTRRIEKGA